MFRSEKFIILSQWKNEICKYYILFIMVREIFGICILIDVFEMVFNIGGRFLSFC